MPDWDGGLRLCVAIGNHTSLLSLQGAFFISMLEIIFAFFLPSRGH